MRIRSAALAALAAMTAALAFTASTVSAAPTAPALSATISSAQSGGVLKGVFNIASFEVNSLGQLVAKGTFNGTYTANGVTKTISSAASTVVTNAAGTGSCKILDLVLGPLHLNLLGLVVDLNQVHLTITAQPGPGNLLGNLLCSVANLLNNNSTTGLAALLNQLNQLLAGL